MIEDSKTREIIKEAITIKSHEVKLPPMMDELTQISHSLNSQMSNFLTCSLCSSLLCFLNPCKDFKLLEHVCSLKSFDQTHNIQETDYSINKSNFKELSCKNCHSLLGLQIVILIRLLNEVNFLLE
jgi:hypothetical protein